MASSHFEYLTNQDLVLLDRGYPAFWLFKLILSHGAHFCSRISISKWKIIRKFIQSGKQEQIVIVKIPVSSINSCKKRCLDIRPMKGQL